MEEGTTWARLLTNSEGASGPPESEVHFHRQRLSTLKKGSTLTRSGTVPLHSAIRTTCPKGPEGTSTCLIASGQGKIIFTFGDIQIEVVLERLERRSSVLASGLGGITARQLTKVLYRAMETL